MKPMIYYLNTYCEGMRIAPAGFLKIKQVKEGYYIEIHLQLEKKNADEQGKCVLYIEENGLQVHPLGEITVHRGEGDAVFLHEMEPARLKGVGICLKTEYAMSCFDEQWKDAILTQKKCENEPKEDVKEEVIEEPKQETRQEQKIDIANIRELPSGNWHLSTNSFLIHGYFNYHYLVILEKEDGRYLGVPGRYEVPEKMMALLFGFPEFEKASSEDDAEKPFGYWCCKLVER